MTMPKLNSAVPDVDVLLAMEPEELAGVLLPLAAGAQSVRQERNFIPADVAVIFEGRNTPGGITPYPAGRMKEVERALVEAWEWLRIALLIVPSEFETGPSTWMRLSRRGAQIVKDGSFADYRNAMAFPKALIHPAIADQVWLALARREWDVAVFVASDK